MSASASSRRSGSSAPEDHGPPYIGLPPGVSRPRDSITRQYVNDNREELKRTYVYHGAIQNSAYSRAKFFAVIITTIAFTGAI